MKSTTIFGLFSALTSQAFARNLVLGTKPSTILFSGGVKTWIPGEDPCLAKFGVVLNDHDEDASPCRIHFSQAGFGDLHFEGCGSDHL
jgi:hypothetical protein